MVRECIFFEVNEVVEIDEGVLMVFKFIKDLELLVLFISNV